jgi:hypothetical protein
MYGTIARLRVKPGALDQLIAWGQRQPDAPNSMYYVFQMDNDPNELYLVVITESEEVYREIANSPEQHERYLEMVELLQAEPEWHDGHVVDSYY